MPLVTNSPKQETHLRLEARKSFSCGFWFKTLGDNNLERNIMDITDAVVRFVAAEQTRFGGAQVINQLAEIVNGEAGYARLDLQAATLDLPAGTYPFNMTLVTVEEYSAVIIKGEIEVLENTDQVDDNEYVGINPSQSLTVRLAEQSVTVTVNGVQAPEFEIGTVTTVGNGEDADAAFEGSYPNQILNLWLPSGPAGESPDLTIGSVSLAQEGDPPSATITGTTPDLVLNLVLPAATDIGFLVLDTGDGTLSISSGLLEDNGDGTFTINTENTESVLQTPSNLGSVGGSGKVFGFSINGSHVIGSFAEVVLASDVESIVAAAVAAAIEDLDLEGGEL